MVFSFIKSVTNHKNDESHDVFSQKKPIFVSTKASTICVKLV